MSYGGEEDEQLAYFLGLDDSNNNTNFSRRCQREEEQEEEEEEAVLSPTDGYFGRSYPSPLSSQVPRIPDVWVADPSLEVEAQQQRDEHLLRGNRRLFAGADPVAVTGTFSPTSSRCAASRPLQPSTPHHHHHRCAPPVLSPVIPRGTTTTAANHWQDPSPFPSHLQRSGVIYTRSSPLLTDVPPPAYTPSPDTFTSSTASNPPPTTNYRTFPAMVRASPRDHGGLMAGQYQSLPQSMGGDPDDTESLLRGSSSEDRGRDGEYTYPRPRTWRERVRGFEWRRHWKTVLLAGVLMALSLGFLVTSARGLWTGGENTSRVTQLAATDSSSPFTTPGEKPTIPALDADGTRLAYALYDAPLSFPDQDRCASSGQPIAYPTQTFTLDLSAPRNLSLFQDISNTPTAPSSPSASGRDVHVTGDIVLRRAGTGTPGPSIVLETLANDERIALDLDWDDEAQRLYILTPLRVAGGQGQGGQPCVTLRATVWVPPTAALDALHVEGVHLGVKLLDNLALRWSFG